MPPGLRIPMRATPPRRSGFTLPEMIISITMMTLVTGVAVMFFRFQANSISNNSGRQEAIQNMRYIQNAIDRELRLAGGETGQPLVVMAAPFAVAFNVDLVTNVAGDRNGVYYNPDADTLAVMSWSPTRAGALPLVSKVYPAVQYNDAGGNRSPAETIMYFLRVDPLAGRSDVYTLFRKVNDRDSTVIASNIVIPTDTAYFFRYWRTDASGTITQIANSSLPLYWDTALSPLDSVRVVDMRVSTLYRDVKTARDIIRTVYASTKLYNAGLLKGETCGSAPLPPLNPVATLNSDAFSNPISVTIGWDASLEETHAEKDVSLYFVQRRPVGGTTWEILANIPAHALDSYTLDDFDMISGDWQYAVVAQDCNPQNSSAAIAAQVHVP